MIEFLGVWVFGCLYVWVFWDIVPTGFTPNKSFAPFDEAIDFKMISQPGLP